MLGYYWQPRIFRGQGSPPEQEPTYRFWALFTPYFFLFWCEFIYLFFFFWGERERGTGSKVPLTNRSYLCSCIRKVHTYMRAFIHTYTQPHPCMAHTSTSTTTKGIHELSLHICKIKNHVPSMLGRRLECHCCPVLRWHLGEDIKRAGAQRSQLAGDQPTRRRRQAVPVILQDRILEEPNRSFYRRQKTR